MQKTKLSSLPAQIGELGNLTKLNLSSSQLTSLPAEIIRLENLEFLDLNRNPFTNIPPEIFDFLTKLQYGYSEAIRRIITKNDK